MFWSTSVLLLGLAHFAASKPLASKRWDDFEVKHAWVEVPRGWELHGPAPSDYTFDMRIGLKQDKFDELVTALYEVSDPAHERYGQHLSKEDVAALVAPHPDSVNLVEAWLLAHGLDTSSTHRSSSGDFITIRVSVAQAEKMLGTQYQVFRHGKSDDYVIRTMNYSLPSVLHEHVAVVAPTTYFGTMKSMKATSFIQEDAPTIENDADFAHLLKGPGSLATVPSSCSTTITPACLRALYNTVNYTPKATTKNSLGVAGYLDEFANRADLQTFFQRFRSDAVGSNFTTVRVNNGGDDQSDPGVEANLDIQYTEGISFPTPNIYYSTGGSPPFKPDDNTPTNTNEPYLDWLNFILAQDTIPQTFTTSYGDDEQTVPFDYATSVCNLFAQLGARGSSIMFSSGDDGVGAGDCFTNDGTNTKHFQPNFPASCPFVTTVGGTIRVNPEVAVSFSGGGFSNYFAQPSYQTAAVTTFLSKLGSTNAGQFNKTGRAYPDVAAQGQGFQVVIGGRVASVGGTSASSPTFAGVISLLNDFRLSQSKAPLGFLNPIIYSTGAAGFNDITSGSNPGCGTNGFTAGTGWDPVTGLGTPDFVKLQSLIG
ncbi:subtilisin-like protein [Lentinus tigrinus ALCF2SS1-7]|uniref:tripeptidyl-peptidase II n=1 Tax=Lentinus tigrinus ALCF2SS1-6 TaxID=1328759 RepID=A0A5C2SKK0_9APHY|nr:subtilisin-like protein [Lentinus tigrinus ALCF2SS1-6]RPD76371.1 subtilisin-like protein [Lentinus tigrinus ALCF2SS1-7]